MKFEKFYRRSPYLLKNILVTFYGLYENYKRKGAFHKAIKTDLLQNLYSGRQKIEEYKDNQLRALLKAAYLFSPYYSKKMKDAGIDLEDIKNSRPHELLTRIPFLEKPDLKKNLSLVALSEEFSKTFAIVSTSGTTGAPMEVPFDKMGRQRTYAEWDRYYIWLGLPKKFKSIRFSGRVLVDTKTRRPPFWVHNYANRQLFMSSYHLNEDYLPSYIKKIVSYKPDFIDGYPSAIYIISEYIIRKDINIGFTPKAISVTAETLFDYQRESIEKAFGCKVYNQYASSEGAPWIVQCGRGNYHLWDDTGAFEFINISEGPDGHRLAELSVTSFRNFKTPLIRYKIGDTVLLPDEEKSCDCGSPFPVISEIYGRADDFLYTEERGKIGRMDPVYKGIKGIVASKLVQHSINDLEVVLVVNDGFDGQQEILLKKNVQDRLGHKISIRFSYMNSVPLGKNAKFKAVERRFHI